MKKLISLFLVLCISVGMFSLAVYAKSENILILGDANIDADVNIKDATEIQKSVANLITLPDNAVITADCDGDAKVSIKDATWIQKFSADIPCPYPLGEEIVGQTQPTESAPDISIPTTKPTEETQPVTTPAVTPVKPDTNITIYFSNNASWTTVNAYLYNDTTDDKNAQWPGVPMTLDSVNSFGESIYKMNVDVTKFNRVIFNNGTSQTMNAAVTVASSGYFITTQTPKKAMGIGLYAFGTDDYGTKTTTTLKYPTGYNKRIEIWTPAGYNAADTSKKYSVIYLLDGQNQFDDNDPYNGGWGSDEIITSLMQNGGDGIILVGIDNSTYRDNELTPDIGDVVPSYANGFENGSGETFANFVAKTVVPYIEANYNVFTDAAHTAVVGSSSGGIEAFYIGMEYTDEFGMIGALSPAFLLYDKTTWDSYLEKFDFANTKNLPRIYFYNGEGDALELEIMPNAKGMIQWLSDLGYPESKMVFKVDDKNAHNECAWRSVMPEVVSWLFELQ